MRTLFALLSIFGLFGCLSTTEPPLPTGQAMVEIPSRLYLVEPLELNLTDCQGLFDPVTDAALDPAFTATTAESSYNCYIDLNNDGGTRMLPVDVTEVTNVQYQLCVDSGACNEPDPSEEEDSTCSPSDDFDNCPVAQVTPLEAQNYCQWVGRRLPSMYEMLVIRQAALPITADGFPIPPNQTLSLLPTDERDPLPLEGYPCSDAVTANGGCTKARPVGTSPGDALEIVRGSGTIFDLVGNVTELVRDQEQPAASVALENLPWFCADTLDSRAVGETPVCPDGEVCAWASYDPDPGEPTVPFGTYPLCVAHQDATSGRYAVHVGASFADPLGDSTQANATIERENDIRKVAGYFSRRVDFPFPSDTLRERSLSSQAGFRCVGDRTDEGLDASGFPVEFSDTVEPVRGE